MSFVANYMERFELFRKQKLAERYGAVSLKERFTIIYYNDLFIPLVNL